MFTILLQQLQQQFLNITNMLGFSRRRANQIAKATNQNVIIGNIGATTTGAQTASPINVKI
jgi:hypothetical protein